MNTPLFTAEASLYKTSSQYNTTSTYFFATAEGNVMPQQTLLWSLPGGCIPGCLCIVAEGCPCCPWWMNPPWDWPTPFPGGVDPSRI